MDNPHDITILLANLGERELAPAEKSRLARVVEANQAVFAKVRDDLWATGDQQTATKVDRLISSFLPACQPQSALAT